DRVTWPPPAHRAVEQPAYPGREAAPGGRYTEAHQRRHWAVPTYHHCRAQGLAERRLERGTHPRARPQDRRGTDAERRAGAGGIPDTGHQHTAGAPVALPALATRRHAGIDPPAIPDHPARPHRGTLPATLAVECRTPGPAHRQRAGQCQALAPEYLSSDRLPGPGGRRRHFLGRRRRCTGAGAETATWCIASHEQPRQGALVAL